MGGGPTLQNGGHYNLQRPSEARGLDGESRSEERIHHHLNSSPPPTVSEVQSGRNALTVYLSPIWPLLCPMDIHQGNEAPDDTAEIIGNQDNNLYRRHAYPGGDKRGGKSTPKSVAVSPGSSELHCQSREVVSGPSTKTGIPRVIGGLAESPAQTAR